MKWRRRRKESKRIEKGREGEGREGETKIKTNRLPSQKHSIPHRVSKRPSERVRDDLQATKKEKKKSTECQDEELPTSQRNAGVHPGNLSLSSSVPKEKKVCIEM